MPAWALAVLSGWSAGMLHVGTGVDHLAALLPLSVGRRWRAAATGAGWGLGHSAGVLLVGGLALLWRERLDLQLVGAWGERSVGAMLVALGLWGVRRALRLHVHSHTHAHAPGPATSPAGHAHLHAHFDADLQQHPAPAWRHGHAAFGAGVLHGVAGTAHLLGVLPALALPGWTGALAYLVAFAAGTVLAMAVFAGLVGAGSAWLAGGTPRALRATLLAAGLATLAIGGWWLTLAARAPAGAAAPA